MCRSKAAGGHRCSSPSHSPASRKLGRVAFRLYGTDTVATREAVSHLNPEYVNGSVADRRRIGRAAIDQEIRELAARDPKTAADTLPHALTSGLSLTDLGIDEVQAGEVTLKEDKSNEFVPKIPASLITEMVRDTPSDFSLAVVLATSEGEKDYIVSLTTDEWDLVRQRLADEAYRTDSPERLAILAEVDDYGVRVQVFENPKTPTAVLDAAIRNKSDYYIRQLVMEHPNISNTSFNKFAKDVEPEFRGRVAGSRRATPETLAILATDKEEHVRQSVASNEAVHPDILSALAQDSNDTVRWTVAENLRTPPAVLTALKNDSEFVIRESANATIKNRARKKKS